MQLIIFSVVGTFRRIAVWYFCGTRGKKNHGVFHSGKKAFSAAARNLDVTIVFQDTRRTRGIKLRKKNSFFDDKIEEENWSDIFLEVAYQTTMWGDGSGACGHTEMLIRHTRGDILSWKMVDGPAGPKGVRESSWKFPFSS